MISCRSPSSTISLETPPSAPFEEYRNHLEEFIAASTRSRSRQVVLGRGFCPLRRACFTVQRLGKRELVGRYLAKCCETVSQELCMLLSAVHKYQVTMQNVSSAFLCQGLAAVTTLLNMQHCQLTSTKWVIHS